MFLCMVIEDSTFPAAQRFLFLPGALTLPIVTQITSRIKRESHVLPDFLLDSEDTPVCYVFPCLSNDVIIGRVSFFFFMMKARLIDGMFVNRIIKCFPYHPQVYELVFF